MLQGNPFETELVVRERTQTVRQEMDVRLPSKAEQVRRLQRWWRAIISHFRAASISPQNLQTIED